MPVSHFSEDPTISQFVPRAPLARPLVEPLVWAIDDAHAPLYFLPRDCPRVCFWPLVTTTAADRIVWFGTVTARMVIAIESAWLERVRVCTLYRYTLSDETFVDTGDHGVHVSHTTITPVSVEPVGDLLRALVAADVELRVMPSLTLLGEAVTATSLYFSLIRMRNARGWTKAT